MKTGIDDYFAAGHSVDEFFALVRNTPPAPGSFEAPIAFAELMAADYPPTEFAWGDFIIKGEVNLLYGDGGVGKSLLSQYIGGAIAAGRPLFGNPTIQMPVIGMFAEDGPGEVKRRFDQIMVELGLPYGVDLPIKLWCRPREDTLLAVVDDNGEVSERPRLQMLRAELEKSGPALVILDSLADLFALDESQRLPVNAALKRVLGGLCRNYGATAIVLAHPSKAAMQDGTHYSGSTAFNNAVRQRLTLEIDWSDKPAEGPPPRRFSVAKSNYGPPAVKTLWFYGTTIQEAPRASAEDGGRNKQIVLGAVLDLRAKSIRVVNNISGHKGGDARTITELSKTIAEQSFARLSPAQVKDILRQLVDDGALIYLTADNSAHHYQKATFERGPKCPL